MSREYPTDGGPAFPPDSFAAQHCPGMSVRDWLVGQALAGSLSYVLQTARDHGANRDGAITTAAELALDVADAVLKARGVEP